MSGWNIGLQVAIAVIAGVALYFIKRDSSKVDRALQDFTVKFYERLDERDQRQNARLDQFAARLDEYQTIDQCRHDMGRHETELLHLRSNGSAD